MKHSAFTLLELLVVIAIIAIIIAILLPALSGAREAANVAYDLANLGKLNETTSMYINDAAVPNLPWYVADFGFRGINTVTEYSWGGFQHTIPNPDPRFSMPDTMLLKTSERPYNKYIAKGVDGTAPIKSYICPSDKTWITPLVGSSLPPGLPNPDAYSSWQVQGNSYAINWYWLQGPPWNGEPGWYDSIASFSQAGQEMLSRKLGGEAAKFVVFTESCMNYFMYDARPRSGNYGVSELQYLGPGWHRKWSTYSLGFLDGHAEFRYVDTRFSDDTGFDIWPTIR